MGTSKGRGPTIAKDVNRQIIYRQMKQSRETTRVDLARTLNLHKNTVNAIIGEFMETGFVEELGQQAQSGAGRKATVIRFQARNKWAIGVQITSDVIHWAVTDLYAQPIASYSVPLRDAAPDNVVQSLLSEADKLLATYGADACVGMCIGIPGLMEEHRSSVIHSSHLSWQHVPLLALLKDWLSIPLKLDNSVKLASLGEQWHGSGSGSNDFAYCYFGNGVGCSLVASGSVVRGSVGAAGELGHFVLEPDGPLCGCGNRGCLEALVSLPALLRQISEADGAGSSEPLSWKTVLDRLHHKDPVVLEVLRGAGRTIGQALSYVVNLLNPKLVVCDGPLMQASSILFPHIEAELQRRCLSAVIPVRVARSELYPYASCIGAAADAIQTWEAATYPL
ncbi:ROK family protein [Paenibacillus ferrarius]|uniref:ROK family protein n=1 Tax=Paenibacillus ferrarius TaxID=1469647 RepID=UPI003D2D8A95